MYAVIFLNAFLPHATIPHAFIPYATHITHREIIIEVVIYRPQNLLSTLTTVASIRPS